MRISARVVSVAVVSCEDGQVRSSDLKVVFDPTPERWVLRGTSMRAVFEELDSSYAHLFGELVKGAELRRRIESLVQTKLDSLRDSGRVVGEDPVGEDPPS